MAPQQIIYIKLPLMLTVPIDTQLRLIEVLTIGMFCCNKVLGARLAQLRKSAEEGH